MKKLVNFRITVFLVIALCLGVACALNFSIKNYLTASLYLSAFVIFYALFLFFAAKGGKLKVGLILLSVFCLIFVLGGLNTGLKIKNYQEADLNNHYFEVIGTVKEVGDTEYGQAAVLTDVYLYGADESKCSFNIAVYVSGNSNLKLGDRVIFGCYLTDRAPVYDGRFSAESVSSRIKYNAAVNISDLTVLENRANLFQKVNIFIKDVLSRGLEGDEFAVAYALMTGNSDFIRVETLTNYRSAGIAHIFAVSGLHIGFLATALGFLLKKCKCNKYVRAVVVVLVCLFYSGVCGFSSSSIRATVMCAVTYGASLLGERYDGLSSVSISAFLILVFKPLQLFCVGFQLSFGVVLGMILLSRPISKAFKFLPWRVANSLGAVLAAQITGIPISLAAFGEFSAISIIANLIFIPVVGFIYIFLFLCVILAAISGLYVAFLFLPKYVLTFVNMCINAFDYKIFMVGGIVMGGFAFFYYATAMVLSGLINFGKLVKMIVSISLATVCVVGTVVYSVVYAKATKLCVFGSSNVSIATFTVNRESTLIIVDASFESVEELASLCKRCDLERVDNVILMKQDEKFELYPLVDCLIAELGIKGLYYYGEKDYTAESVVSYAYKDFLISSLLDGEKLSLEEYSIICFAEGKGIAFATEDRSVAVFGRFGERAAALDGAKGECDAVVAYDYEGYIYSVYEPENFYTFRYSEYANGENHGVLKIIL